MARPTDPQMRDVTAAELARRLQDASVEDATPLVEELIARFTPLLRNAWRGAPANLDYDDYAQEVFMKLFSTLGRLRAPEALAAYLATIAHSVRNDHLRRAQRTGLTVSIDEVDVESDAEQDLLEAVYIRSYLEALSGREREVLELEVVEQCSPQEIMDRTGLTRGGISAAKSRAVRRLSRLWREEAARLDKDVSGRSRDQSRQPKKNRQR